MAIDRVHVDMPNPVRDHTDAIEAAVSAYVAARPWLAEVIDDAQHQIARVFGANARVRLEVVVDDEDAEQLSAFISPSLAPEAAYAALARFDDEWLIDAPTRGQFNVDVEVGASGNAV